MTGAFLSRHGGGMVPLYAHAGWPLAADERLIVAQTGEGILPRPSMARLGPARFEALRRGDFEAGGGGGDAYTIHYTPVVHIKALDSRDVDRVLEKHLQRQQGTLVKLMQKAKRDGARF